MNTKMLLSIVFTLLLFLLIISFLFCVNYYSVLITVNEFSPEFTTLQIKEKLLMIIIGLILD
jgi:hypothetical protein